MVKEMMLKFRYWNAQRCFWSPVDGIEDYEPIVLFDSEIAAMNPQFFAIDS
jgi:hypothetical protein